MCGLARIDGKPYRFMGPQPNMIPAMNQVRLGWVAALETGDPHVIEPLWAVVDGFRATGHFLVSSTYGVFADACVHAGRIDVSKRLTV